MVRKFRKFLQIVNQNIIPDNTHTWTPGKLFGDYSPKWVYIFDMMGFLIFEDKFHSLNKSFLLYKLCLSRIQKRPRRRTQICGLGKVNLNKAKQNEGKKKKRKT